MKQGLSFALLLYLLFTLAGCASSSKSSDSSGDSDSSPRYVASGSTYESKAHPAVYISDGMWPNKKRPLRPMNHDMDFFFKHCTGSMSRSYYSKTSYGCERP